MQIIDVLFWGWIIQATLTLGTPLVLAGLGGMFSERSGVVNIALEGMMLMGAWAAVAASWYTDNPWTGVFAAIISGLILGAVHGVISVKLKGNQIVSGTGIILFAAGFTTLMLWVIWGTAGASGQVITLPEVRVPIIGLVSPLTFAMLALIPICWYLLYRTPFGLRLRAAGEDPSTLDTAGISVENYRMYGVLISGMLAAIAGAQMSIGFGSRFTIGMTAGNGFLALAAMIFGNWNPIGTLFAGLFFGFLQAISYGVQFAPGWEWLIGYSSFINMIPYISVIVALGIIRRSVPPKAIGVPYIKEKQV
ncbi:MAG: ABC transporter permease [Candidatus Hermodarchaeota archaeon]|nr:ABC transporter permease [Candidatus Hermodarchaeota archaeon]